MSTLHLCPLCSEIHEEDYERGRSSCYHERYETVEPVEVEGCIEDGRLVFVLPDPEEWTATVGAEQLDRQMERDVARINWLALSCDERVAANRARREAMSGMGLAMHDMMVGCIEDQWHAMRRVTFAKEDETVAVRCPKCRDYGCENSTTRVIPSVYGMPIRVEAGSALPD